MTDDHARAVTGDTSAARLVRQFSDFAASVADDVAWEDRRAGLKYAATGKEQLLASIKALELPIISVDPVAAKGDRLALYRVVRKGPAPHGGGDAEVVFLVLHELNDARELATAILFDPDDVTSAMAELDARFATDGQ